MTVRWAVEFSSHKCLVTFKRYRQRPRHNAYHNCGHNMVWFYFNFRLDNARCVVSCVADLGNAQDISRSRQWSCSHNNVKRLVSLTHYNRSHVFVTVFWVREGGEVFCYIISPHLSLHSLFTTPSCTGQFYSKKIITIMLKLQLVPFDKLLAFSSVCWWF